MFTNDDVTCNEKSIAYIGYKGDWACDIGGMKCNAVTWVISTVFR